MAKPDYDIFLGAPATLTGFRTRAFDRDSAPLVAPRFSSGQQGQTDLDLLKSASLDNMDGGMFQRTHEDSHQAARIIGQYNPYDENLYPTPQFTQFSASTFVGLASTSYISAKTENDLYTFVALTRINAGTRTNRLFRIDKDGTAWSEITLPAAIASGTTIPPITDLSLHKNFLYVSGQSPVGAGINFNNHRYNYAANTWQDIAGFGVLMRPLLGILYHINTSSSIFSMTNETAAGSATYTSLDTIGISDPYISVPTDAEVFNGAMYIAKPDGIYRWDGVRAVKILPLRATNLKEFNGSLFFISGAWLYRFDGTTLTKLQYFGGGETVYGMASSPDALLITTGIVASNYSTGDKPLSVVPGAFLLRTYAFNGAAFYILDERSMSYSGFATATPCYVGNRIMVIYADAANNAAFYASSPYSTVATTSQLEVTTSEHDDGFPNIYKSLELLDLNYSGIGASDSLIVTYQLYDGKTWGSWITAGTITSTTSNLLEITTTASKLYKRLRINVRATLAASSSLTLKGVSWRYTLQPRVRWRWRTTITAYGNGVGMTRNDVPITNDSNELTNLANASVKQKTPIFMLGPDYGRLKTGINAAAVSFIIKGRPPIVTDPYSEYSLCALKNDASVWEVLRVSNVSYNAGADETTITVLERGYYGITAGTISADAEFRLAYKVYVTRLERDAPVLDDVTYNEQATTGESQIQREFLLELTEV